MSSLVSSVVATLLVRVFHTSYLSFRHKHTHVFSKSLDGLVANTYLGSLSLSVSLYSVLSLLSFVPLRGAHGLLGGDVTAAVATYNQGSQD